MEPFTRASLDQHSVCERTFSLVFTRRKHKHNAECNRFLNRVLCTLYYTGIMLWPFSYVRSRLILNKPSVLFLYFNISAQCVQDLAICFTYEFERSTTITRTEIIKSKQTLWSRDVLRSK